MTAEMTEQTVEIGALDVLVPGDWFDVLADDDEVAARQRFDALVRTTVPRAGDPQREALIRALLDWSSFCSMAAPCCTESSTRRCPTAPGTPPGTSSPGP